jgi:hypothetical protein
MKRIIRASVAAVALAGCSTTGGSLTTAAVVAKVQADYPVLKAILAAYTASGQATAGTVAAIARGEAILDPEVAALSNAAAPTSVSTVLGDMNTMVAALPAGTLTPALQADITLLLALANAGLVAA